MDTKFVILPYIGYKRNCISLHVFLCKRDKISFVPYIGQNVYTLPNLHRANIILQVLLHLNLKKVRMRNGDSARTRAFCVKGQSVQLPVRATNLGLSASVIARISIQSCVGIDNARDGNVNGEMFLEVFKRDILPLGQSWPGKRSVVALDNAAVHMKYLIDAECLAKDVIALHLPPYYFDYNPIH
jgi:hypothetical protein